jgi:8-oxo-dGTP pyrophosphatase MutT (NUDIX family)
MLVGKVTALIVRPSPAGEELLLFRHAHAGIQIPSGTIDPGETPEAAVLREAAEETGLTEFVAIEPLGSREIPLPADRRMVAKPVLLYTRPSADHSYGLQLRAGISVRLEREAAGFAQITYEERDEDATPPYVSYRITGWTTRDHLATGLHRHFFLLRYDRPTSERWQIETDGHRFVLFWAPLAALPALRPPQDTWPAMLPAFRAGEP